VLGRWKVRLEREKRISEVLLKCRRSTALTSFRGWIPVSKIADLHNTVDPYTDGDSRVFMHIQGEAGGETVHKRGVPPTYFRTNKYTESFQAIVDTYGVARYKEVNPGLFTIVTFPFTFGVMYGDIGHGFLVMMGALYLIWNEKKLTAMARSGNMSEILGYAFGARYALLPMGFFALYCGSIYNDMVSVPLALFESSWVFEANGTYATFTQHDISGSNFSGSNFLESNISGSNATYTVYPYGVDPTWHHSANSLGFFNSLKMKMSVILGVTHMLLGIFLGALNHIYFGDCVSLFAEWIPRVVFMLSTFGYMCMMIIIKWTTDYGCQYGDKDHLLCPKEPPSLIQAMIAMFLRPWEEGTLYEGQREIQIMLVVTALLMIPAMLFLKPCINHNNSHSSLRRQRRGQDGSYQAVAHSDDSLDEERGPMREIDSKGSEGGPLSFRSYEELHEDNFSRHDDDHHHGDDGDDDHGDGQHSFSEELIHQGIHTIEYVLGCVSNTASYLRLWALSLAHAQLAEVFWEKFIQGSLEANNPVFLVVGFAVWAFATFGVLLCMDLLECFLHALRLHWVEFQNKFYNGDGIKYQPFELPSEDDK